MLPMATPSVNQAPDQPSTKPHRVGPLLACASLLCSLAFWAGFVLSYFPNKVRLNLNGLNWLRVMAAAVFLAAVAKFSGGKSWKLALGVALVTAFFAMYIAGG